MEAVIVLSICIVGLVVYWFVAKWFFEVANAKGFYDKKYFWICFWLTWIGYLLIIALPDRSSNPKVVDDKLCKDVANPLSKEEKGESDRVSDLDTTQSNSNIVMVKCPNCKNTIYAPKSYQKWTCPLCDCKFELK